MAQQRDAARERPRALMDRGNLRLGVADSLTGGGLAAQIAVTPGAGDWFRAGVVACASEEIVAPTRAHAVQLLIDHRERTGDGA